MYDSESSLTNILVAFESVLKIEYEDTLTENIIAKAIERLENTLNITIDKDLYSIQSANQLDADNIDAFLSELKLCLEKMCFYTFLKEYHTNMPFTLADVNYLSSDKVSMRTSLAYLSYGKELKSHRANIIPQFEAAINNVPLCTPKRLFIILLMLDKLGIYEGVAVIARLLHLGGLVQ